ncbi:MAG: hypothetical protein ACRDAM_15805 [Casimicrobium sp.]
MSALEIVAYVALAASCIGTLWGFLILVDAHRNDVDPHHDDE